MRFMDKLAHYNIRIKGADRIGRRERPKCRNTILKCGLYPITVEGIWDGVSYYDPKLNMAIDNCMTDGLRGQMEIMVAEGIWGPIRMIAPNMALKYDAITAYEHPAYPKYKYSSPLENPTEAPK